MKEGREKGNDNGYVTKQEKEKKKYEREEQGKKREKKSPQFP